MSDQLTKKAIFTSYYYHTSTPTTNSIATTTKAKSVKMNISEYWRGNWTKVKLWTYSG